MRPNDDFFSFIWNHINLKQLFKTGSNIFHIYFPETENGIKYFPGAHIFLCFNISFCYIPRKYNSIFSKTKRTPFCIWVTGFITKWNKNLCRKMCDWTLDRRSHQNQILYVDTMSFYLWVVYFDDLITLLYLLLAFPSYFSFPFFL